MRPLLLLLTVATLPLVAHAEKGQSIMFGDPDPLYQEKSRDTSTEELSKHCRELRRQMDELKGKPQRRHTIAQRYKLECQSPAQ